jgi:RHS repeat-associated protein
VYFDDFKVEHVKSPVIESRDYYPFGMVFGNYQRENSLNNQYQYNGRELQDELSLGLSDYGDRFYDASISRFTTLDKRAHNYMSYSPYGYVVNNPINNIDVNGNFILPQAFIEKYKLVAQYLENGIQGILDNRRIVDALKKHGGFSDKQIREVLTWGKGPTVEPYDLGPLDIKSPVLGFTGGLKGNPAPLLININMFEELEKAEVKDKEYWLFLIAVTILHESVHYGYNENSLKTKTREEGEDFEKDAYGKVIKMDNYRQVLDQWKTRQSGGSNGLSDLMYLMMSQGSNSGSGNSNSSNGRKKKKPDADKEAAKRSGGWR